MTHIVCCFAYNRPVHTRRALAALAKNGLAQDTVLIVVVDGPAADDDVPAVDAVRQVVRHATGFRRVISLFRDRNLGTVGSLVPAISELLDEYGAAIFLEDDVIVSRYFLDYMNAALVRYQDEPRVMAVSGYMFPTSEAYRLPETFLYRKSTSFAWAGWKSSWSHLSMNCRDLLARLERQHLISRLDGEGAFKLSDLLSRDAEQPQDHVRTSWSPRWFASMILADGLALYPRQSLCRNIGFDGTGVRSPVSSAWDVRLTDFRPTEFPSAIVEHTLAHSVMAHAYAAVDHARSAAGAVQSGSGASSY